MNLDRIESLQEYILNNIAYETGTANNDRVKYRQRHYYGIYDENTNKLRFKPKLYDSTYDANHLDKYAVIIQAEDDTECELERETPVSKELVSSELDSFLCSLRKKEVV